MKEFPMKVKGLGDLRVPIQQAESIAEALSSKQFESEAAILQAAHRARRITVSDTAREMVSKGTPVPEIAKYVNGHTEGASTRGPAGTGGARVKAADRAAGQETIASLFSIEDVLKMPREKVNKLARAAMLPPSYFPRLRDAGLLDEQPAEAPKVAAPAAPAAASKATTKAAAK